MTPKKLSTKEILAQNKARKTPSMMQQVIIILHNIRSMHNVGAAFRCADAFGINKIVLGGVTPAPPRPEITKTAIGAEQFVPWEQVENTRHTLGRLQTSGYQIVGIEQTKTSALLPDFIVPKEKKICLLFGNEVTGIDEALLPLIDTFVEIPQYGNKHSLNVSVAVGVSLYALLQKYWG